MAEFQERIDKNQGQNLGVHHMSVKQIRRDNGQWPKKNLSDKWEVNQ